MGNDKKIEIMLCKLKKRLIFATQTALQSPNLWDRSGRDVK